MDHGTLSLGGGVVIAAYFFGILAVGAIVKPMLRSWHDRADERDDRREDYFAHLREREEWRHD